MTGEYYDSEEQHFWEGPCNDPDCVYCKHWHKRVVESPQDAKETPEAPRLVIPQD